MSRRRRRLLQAGAAGLALKLLPARAQASAAETAADGLQAALLRFTGGAPVAEGGVRLEIPPLVENGNAVPVTLVADEAEQRSVRRLALFTERNPQPEVAAFTLGPASGRAAVHARIRLATSQGLLALVEFSDGSFGQQRVQVVVTLAACVEGA